MSKTTTTIFEIIKSELIHSGKKEFYNDNKLTFFDDDFQFIKKIAKYDKDVELIVTKRIFLDFYFDNKELDIFFKQTFCNMFSNREIGRQTLEDFAMVLQTNMLTMQEYIILLYENYKDMLKGKSQTTSIRNNETSDAYRNLYSTLPQDNVNLNVKDTVLNYGDNNTISLTQNESNAVNNDTTIKFDLDTLLKSKLIFKDIFYEIDKTCFLQKW